MAYWLMKSEPDAFSIDDLKRVGTEPWDGIRNYQVRNMIRDRMKPGDQAFFYHSNTKVPAIVGMMEIVTDGYPDDTAYDPDAKYYDPKDSPENPRWYRVDVRYIRHFERPVTLAQMREDPALADMPLVRKGNRLSVMPLTEAHWQHILGLESGDTN